MALNAITLGNAMKAAVDGLADKTDRDALFRALAQAIVTHIQTQAQVTVVSVSGVTTGPGVSGPGLGTIS